MSSNACTYMDYGRPLNGRQLGLRAAVWLQAKVRDFRSVCDDSADEAAYATDVVL